MDLSKLYRKLYIKTTNLTHGYQDNNPKIVSFYRLWAPFYDISIKLDPAYRRNLFKMVEATVSKGDHTLDIGCGTGFATVISSKISKTVIGVDSSKEMLKKLENKIRKLKLTNVELRDGFFPAVVRTGEVFDSIISSFMLAHLSQDQRRQAVRSMFEILKPNGKIGLFSAQGEIAPTFQSRKEIGDNLKSAGFTQIKISDVDDIYRIATAAK